MKRSSTRLALIPIAWALFLSGGSPLTPNPPKSRKIVQTQDNSAKSENHYSPHPHPPIVTVGEKEASAPELKQITVIIQQQSYKHWWQTASAPEWALFVLTIPYVVVTIALFVVGRRSADAAKENADSLVNIERAWLMLDRLDSLTLVAMPLAGQPTISGAVFEYRNFGRTPSWIVESAARMIIVPSRETLTWPLDYGPTNLVNGSNGTPVPPDQPTNPTWQALEPPFPTEAQIQSIQREESFAFLFAFIRYRDVFARTRETRFCVQWQVASGFRTTSGWIYAGPKEANRNT